MKRQENGLIEGINYIKDEKTGKIDWFKLIPVEYLYLNEEKKASLEKRLNKPFAEIQVNEVKDTDLIITLQGIRWLLDVRGYKYAKTKIDQAAPDFAASTCEICFIPNEEEKFEQVFSCSASAHRGNTKSWYQNYLTEASSNRAFCRTVRNYLKINVVSKEELRDNDPTEDNQIDSNPISPANILLDKLKQKNITFGKLVNQIQAKIVKGDLKKEEFEGIEAWTEASQVPKGTILKMIDLIKKVEEKKKS